MLKYFKRIKLFLNIVWRKFFKETNIRLDIQTAYKVSKIIHD